MTNSSRFETRENIIFYPLLLSSSKFHSTIEESSRQISKTFTFSRKNPQSSPSTFPSPFVRQRHRPVQQFPLNEPRSPPPKFAKFRKKSGATCLRLRHRCSSCRKYGNRSFAKFDPRATDFASGSGISQPRGFVRSDNGGGGGKTVINHGGFGRRNRERRRDEKGGRLEKSERRRYITAAISLPPPLLSSAITRDGIVAPLSL